jgi:L-alanine-DL-glutamate epimerase-like enolase superfamily enzyme
MAPKGSALRTSCKAAAGPRGPWLTPAFAVAPQMQQGRMLSPDGPGLGLEVNPNALDQFRW